MINHVNESQDEIIGVIEEHGLYELLDGQRGYVHGDMNAHKPSIQRTFALLAGHWSKPKNAKLSVLTTGRAEYRDRYEPITDGP